LDKATITNFVPGADVIQFDHTVFCLRRGGSGVLAATHDDSLGNAVITDAAHDTITLQHVATAQMLTFISDGLGRLRGGSSFLIGRIGRLLWPTS